MDAHLLITAQAVAEAISIERERCAKIADEWLTVWAERTPQYVSAQTWACDAVKDIAAAIRARGALPQDK